MKKVSDIGRKLVEDTFVKQKILTHLGTKLKRV
jgi:hypothetical protein